jgi:hypothetical protein
MASLKDNHAFAFTGKIGNVSAFTMRGYDKIFLRGKGGASKRKIKTSKKFEVTRQLNNEWKGVTLVSAVIRQALHALKPLADYNISGPMNALVKKIQSLDDINPKGQRAIFLSRRPELFSSFNYNQNTIFDSIVRQPLSFDLNKSDGTCEVRVPTLQPGINFFPHPRFSYCRIVLSLAAVNDYFWNAELRNYFSKNPQSSMVPEIYTPWMQTNKVEQTSVYHLALNSALAGGTEILMLLGVGVQYGIPSADGSIQPAPYVGAAKIIGSL